MVCVEHEELLHVLATIDRATRLGRRDDLILRIFFDTGARGGPLTTRYRHPLECRHRPGSRPRLASETV
ncbi:MAG: hypothetical protein ACT4TC_23535 [Myxococcaceae bacterium]